MQQQQINLEELPVEVLAYVVKLRKEAARMRVQRNELRAELDALRSNG